MFYRLQATGIELNEMRSWTSDFESEEYLDEYMFDSEEEYLAALQERANKYEGTICVSDNAYETNWGGANGVEGEVVVLEGVVAFYIYDGVRLYSASLVEVARFPAGTWAEMQNTGEVGRYE